MPAAQRRPVGLHLAWLLLIAIAGAFVTTLIVITRDLASFWPLYILPIVIAALTYHISGAAISIATTAALVTLLAYTGSFGSPPTSELVIGLMAYTASGIVIGLQAQRYQHQSELLRHGSMRDPLTGAWTAEHFEDRLAEEVRRSGRYGQSCACVLVEVVDFTDFRREFGRVKADLLLVRMAKVLSLAVRETDQLGREKEARFALILPSADEQQTRTICARIESSVGETEFEGDALEPTTYVKVDVTAAIYPAEADTSTALLLAAERRLRPARKADATTGDRASASGESGELTGGVSA